MNCLILAAIFAMVEPQPTEQAAPQPLEQAISSVKEPNGKHVMVQARILVEKPNAKKGMHVKFIDVKGSPAVNIKKWDAKLGQLKPGTTITVTGELHYGTVPGGTPSIRYKIKEVGGKKYTDHRHWRTDKAIYIINPSYVISAPGPDAPAKEEPAKNSLPAKEGPAEN